MIPPRPSGPIPGLPGTDPTAPAPGTPAPAAPFVSARGPAGGGMYGKDNPWVKKPWDWATSTGPGPGLWAALQGLLGGGPQQMPTGGGTPRPGRFNPAPAPAPAAGGSLPDLVAQLTRAPQAGLPPQFTGQPIFDQQYPLLATLVKGRDQLVPPPNFINGSI